MGLDLIFTCDNHQLSIRFTSAEWQIIARLRAKLPDSIDVLFSVSDIGQETIADLASLKMAVEAIDDLLLEQPDLLPYIYQFKPEYILLGPPENDDRLYQHQFSTGGLSGIKLPNDDAHRYMIHAGLDKLRLTKVAVQPDGTYGTSEDFDIREQQELHTENSGLIQFRKRRADTEFRKWLVEINKFLDSVQGSEVVKVIA